MTSKTQKTDQKNDALKELSEWAAQLPCMLDDAHRQRVKSFSNGLAVIECPECKEKLGITNELIVKVKPK